MIRSRLLLAASALSLSLAVGACNVTTTDGNQTAAAAAPEAGTALGIKPAAIDRSVAPGDDFYQFANGGWMKTAEIPADRSSIGAFFIADQVREKNTRALFDELLKGNADANSDGGRIANYYKAYLNTDAIDKAGIAPAKADLDAIAAIADKRALASAIGSTLRADVDPLNATNYQTDNLFGIFVTQGLNTPGETLPYILQGGLGMPEREYYLSSDGKMAALRDKYRSLCAAGHAGGRQSRPGRRGRPRSSTSKPRSRRPTPAARRARTSARPPRSGPAPSLKRTRPASTGAPCSAPHSLAQRPSSRPTTPTAIPKLAALVGSEPLDAWKDWLAFHTLNQQANVLPAPIRNASFAFNGTALQGTPQQRPRDILALNATSNALQDAVGKAYVDKYFPASAKAEVQQMVDNIKAAFAKRVEALDWMAPSTKAEALAKVKSIVVGVGYPDTWRDYSAVSITPDNAYANQKAAGLAEYKHQLAKIGKPMDRAEWWMPPQLVNAVNLPVQNALNFPAAILVAPFFDPKADPAYNYGAIGSVIGHEISHSFDNNGALFDSTGKLAQLVDAAGLRALQPGRRCAGQAI